MDFSYINTPVAALMAGLVTSLHCAGMCGPMACAFMPGRGERADARTVATAYHVSRLAAYALLGALAGGLGRLPLQSLPVPVLRWVPWVFVLVFVALALRWERLLPRLPRLGLLLWRVQAFVRTRSRVGAAAAFGAATPLLPCGPLYFIVALALLSGSALRGAEFMLAFGLGTVPLLWVAQSQFLRIRERLGPRGLERVRVSLALLAAGVMAWRLRGTFGFEGPDPASLVCF